MCKNRLAVVLSAVLLFCGAKFSAAEINEDGKPLAVHIERHLGRPVVFIDGKPHTLPVYNPMNLDRPGFERTARGFVRNQPAAYIIAISRAAGRHGWWTSRFWIGEEVSSEPLADAIYGVDEQAEFVLNLNPNAYLIVRFGTHEPPTWSRKNQQELFVNEDGVRMQVPSLASRRYNEMAAAFSRAVIEYCERQPWADRVIGYANFTRVEGTHEPLVQHYLFDHSELMQARWREFLKQRYETVEALREAWGDNTVDFDTVQVPRDRLREPLPKASQVLYWQPAAENHELTRQLYREHFRMTTEAMADALKDRRRFLVYDTLKQTMLGWSNSGFFRQNVSWPILFADDRAGSGGMAPAA